MMDISKETVSFRHNRIDAHMNSQKLEQDSQALHRLKPDIPGLRGLVNTGFPVIKKLYAIYTHGKKKKSIYSNGVSLDI